MVQGRSIGAGLRWSLRGFLAAGGLAFAAAGACADGPPGAEPDPWRVCEQAAGAAELEAGLPSGLLLAVGKVESGRANPGSGRTVPWPFSVNVEGGGRVFPSAGEAIAHVLAAQARGARSIDVGCFQVNLQHHPLAFPGLAEAFDPARNAGYAARLLARHFARTGSWSTASGDYHSMNPALGGAYAARVASAWQGGAAGGVAGSRSAAVQPPFGLPTVWQPGGLAPLRQASGPLPTVFVPGRDSGRAGIRFLTNFRLNK